MLTNLIVLGKKKFKKLKQTLQAFWTEIVEVVEGNKIQVSSLLGFTFSWIFVFFFLVSFDSKMCSLKQIG